MKIVASILCFCLIFVFACEKNLKENAVSEINPPDENPRLLISKFDKPILEVTSDFWGMIWINGKVVDIRLFEDGIAEYDDYPTTSKTQIKAEEVKITKKLRISDEQVKDFIDFLTSREFLNTKDKYTKKNCFSYDAGRNIKVNFRYKGVRKRIEVIGYCDVLPTPISDLLERIEKTTNQGFD